MPPLRGTEDLTGEQRELARALRQAARIVGHAALPAEYRAAAFGLLAPIIVAGTPVGPDRDAPLVRSDESPFRTPGSPARSW